MFRAPLIAVEGLDSAGKSSLCIKIHEYLSKTNNELTNILYTPDLVSFPRRFTNTGKILDRYLRNELELDELIAHHLFSANRWEVKEYIETLLGAQHPVILDRYVASGIAYTAAKGTFSIEFCKQFNVGLPRPDLTIFLKKDSEIVYNRPSKERYETQIFQTKVKDIFVQFERNENDWITIDVKSNPNDWDKADVLTSAITAIDQVIRTFQQSPIPIKHYT